MDCEDADLTAAVNAAAAGVMLEPPEGARSADVDVCAMTLQPLCTTAGALPTFCRLIWAAAVFALRLTSLSQVVVECCILSLYGNLHQHILACFGRAAAES